MPAYPVKKKTRIAYKSAPSGYINIDKWEPPFMKVEDGYGYVGVIAEDFETGKLQCHMCGKWFEQLSTHIISVHRMDNCNQYRKDFGLFQGTALKSKRLRLIQSKTIQKLQKEGRMQVGNNLGKSPFKKGKANKYAANRKGWKKPIEGANRYGRCDLQIMTKIIELSRELGRTPSLVDIKEKYGGGIISVMHSRYGSYINYCRQYLKMKPCYSSLNPKFGSKKRWREHLIKIGKESIKAGNPITTNGLLPMNESRYVYRWFRNWGDYKKHLLK